MSTECAGTGSRMAKKVLIVEDNELNMKLFHDLLDAQGYETLQPLAGLQGLVALGVEVTKRLKEDEDLASIPVVAVTAFAMKGDEERIREGGCEAYISKTISEAHFLAT